MNWDIFGTIIVGLLSCAGTVCGAYFANRKASALMLYRLEKLEEEVRKHNGVIERTYKLETAIEVLQEEMKHKEDKG